MSGSKAGLTEDWWRWGEGVPPTLAWNFATEAPLVALRWARETGEVLAADAVGGMYQLDSSGRLANLIRGPSPIRALSFSDTGGGGVALVGDDKLYWFNHQLVFQGCLEHSEQASAISLDPHGEYAAVSLADAELVLYDSFRRRIRTFSTQQPLIAVEFIPTVAELIGVAEYGLLCRYSFSGTKIFQQPLYSNVGDLAVARGGDLVLLACFSHGIQVHDETGEQVGSYQVGGTACRVAASYSGRKVAVVTMERHFYLVDETGHVEWQAILPDDVCRVACDPLGHSVLVGFQSGRIARLDWPSAR